MTDPTTPAPPTAAHRQPAYDAVFAYIRSFGEDLPTDLVGRNAMIWRAVNAALDAMAAAPAPSADRSALRDRIADVLAEADGWVWATERDKARSSTYRGYQSRAEAVLAVLPEPADRAAAVASCPGYEASPNPCRCPCYGCKHHCGAHNPEDIPAPADRAEWDAPCREADRLRRASAETVERADRIEAEVQRLAADRAAVLDEAADAVARYTGNDVDANAKMLRRMAAEARQADRSPVKLPYTHTDDDTDQLHIGVTMASTLDAESATVYVSVEQRGRAAATAYIRSDLVEGVVAALRAARTEADRLAAEARDTAPSPRVARLTEMLTSKPGHEEADRG
ncbi:hypothetical protein [Streptomyces acidiscabies]|uniref:hypothetical protein n=1 Tax=Streptomyces acidiscabies TaxID=42234 RepID=UPI000952420E|nr:hypothetical protein [Streptomyces acidiscabies]